MPPAAYALVALFALISLAVGVLAARALAPRGGPRGPRAVILPAAAAFLVLYLVGHRFGLVLGPEIGLFGFRVALLGDVAIGLAAGFAAALLQAGLVRAAGRARA